MDSELKKTPGPEGVTFPKDVAYDVVIVPERVSDAGMGLYSDDSVEAMKELREAGVNVGYLHSADKRHVISKHGFDPITIQIAIGIVSNLGAKAIEVLVGKIAKSRPDAQLTVKMGHYTKANDGAEKLDWFEVSGSPEEVKKALSDANQSQTGQL